MPKSLKQHLGKPVTRFIFNYWDWSCAYCGRRSKFLTFDHVIPKCKNGETKRKNLVPACHTCNLEKGTMKVENFASLAELKEILRYTTLSKKFPKTYDLLYGWYSKPNWFRWEK